MCVYTNSYASGPIPFILWVLAVCVCVCVHAVGMWSRYTHTTVLRPWHLGSIIVYTVMNKHVKNAQFTYGISWEFSHVLTFHPSVPTIWMHEMQYQLEIIVC